MIEDDPTESGASGPAFDSGATQMICTGVYYFGMVPGSSQYPDPKKKIMFQFTSSERYEGGDFNGYKAIGTNPMTFTTNEEGNLGKLLAPYIGRVPTKDDLKKIDILLGRNVLANLVHTDKGGKTYANVTSISKLVKGMPDITLDDSLITPVFYNVLNHSTEDFLKMPERGLARRTAVTSLSFTDQMFADLPAEVANELAQYRMAAGKPPAGKGGQPAASAQLDDFGDESLPF